MLLLYKVYMLLFSVNNSNTIEISEAVDLESRPPPSKNSEKKPLKVLKPNKAGMDVKRHRKLTSEVWNSFEFMDPDENGELFCKCKQCRQVYNAESRMGTGNLKRRLKNCKKSRFKNIGQMVLDYASGSGSSTSRLPEFNPTTFRELLASVVVRHELPFQFVEYEGIRDCFTYLNSEVKVVSRNTIRSDVLKMYRMEKVKIRDALSCVPGRICLTSDYWTSITTDGYMSLTTHFIDNSWIILK